MRLRMHQQQILARGVGVDEAFAALRESLELGRPGPAVRVTGCGPVGDWIALRFPGETHPWHVHNLAVWLVQGASRVLVLADGETPEAGHHLQVEGERLVGHQEDGTPLIVAMPEHEVWRGVAHRHVWMPRLTWLLTQGVDPRLVDGSLPVVEVVDLPMEALGDTLSAGMGSSRRPYPPRVAV